MFGGGGASGVEDEALIAAIEAASGDALPELVYTEWLEKRGDRRAEVLKLRSALLRASYSDVDYRHIAELLDQYRAAVAATDPDWVARLGKARPWVSEESAVTFVQVHLRAHHGRRLERQWVRFWHDWGAAWAVHYWRDDPATLPPTRTGSRKQVWVLVDKVSGQVGPAPIHA